jgi:hypothetical protein
MFVVSVKNLLQGNAGRRAEDTVLKNVFITVHQKYQLFVRDVEQNSRFIHQEKVILPIIIVPKSVT